MRVMTIDFETYYDQDYSLKKLSTEEYVRDPRFEVIGVGIKEDSTPAVWYPKPDVAKALADVDWGDVAVLAHNTFFDGAILSWHYGVTPRLWLDTLSMARPMHTVEVGLSLAALATHYNLGAKGSEITETKGMRYADLVNRYDILTRFSVYCLTDVELTYRLFQKLKEKIPAHEIQVIHQNISMYTRPLVELDQSGLIKHIDQCLMTRAELVAACGIDEATLRSNDKFAAFLQSLGVEPPQKISIKTGNLTWAMSKNDTAFAKLLEHPNDRVSRAVAARLGVRSSIELTRAQSLLGVSQRGRLPVMLHYYGAHTGRDSGGDGLNLQNLPRNGALRRCLVAPEGYKFLAADLSQIEARITAWLAGEWGLLEEFANQDQDPTAEEDVYTKFASKLFGKRITKADKPERFIGKTCILGLGYGMAANKLALTLSNAKNVALSVDKHVAFEYVKTYHHVYPKIPHLWAALDRLLLCMTRKEKADLSLNGEFTIETEDGDILLPNGMVLHYPALILMQSKYNWARPEPLYARSRSALDAYIAHIVVHGEEKLYEVVQKHFTPLRGASLLENIVQALANILLKKASIEIGRKYPTVLRVHDEVVALIPKGDELIAETFVKECMTRKISWAPNLPINCEIGVATNYGDC